MFLDGGIPRAVAIVSPLKDDSKTTKAPWTPLPIFFKKIKEKFIDFSSIGSNVKLKSHSYVWVQMLQQIGENISAHKYWRINWRSGKTL